jgi:hypothetical protein
MDNTTCYIATLQYLEEYSEYYIYRAKDYQKKAYLTFVNGNYEYINFKIPNKDQFTIKKFNNDGYPEFCTLEDNGEHIISNNETKLLNYVREYNSKGKGKSYSGGQISNLNKKKNKKKKRLTKKNY